MFTKHASLTGADLKKLRAPLFEPLQAVAELEAHMGKFVLASIKLSATDHGEDSYRYFELFLESIKGSPYWHYSRRFLPAVPYCTPTERVSGLQGQKWRERWE